MATTTYAIVEYEDKACSLIYTRRPWNTKNIENETVRLLIPFEPGWSYTRSRKGVATTVTLPPMGTKLNKKDEWILPLIVDVMLHEPAN